jgi:exosortase/archaeosortase family protein
LLAFVPALLLLFGLNILRVYVLVMAGYYINPQIAFSLFHTYAGMVFFIIYSGIFWAVSYKWMLQKIR